MKQSTVRGLIGSLMSYGGFEQVDLSTLDKLEKLLEQNKEEVIKEIKIRRDFIKRCQEKGKTSCSCRGVGYGIDGRGDPWYCIDCKPDLKTYWNDK